MKIEELPNISGIYKINFPNGKFYIGKSIHIRKRIIDHKNRDYKLYPHLPISRAIEKYGIIDVEILEVVSKLEELSEREIHWISILDATTKGYNLSPGGDGGFGKGQHNHEASLDAEKIKKLTEMLLDSKYNYEEIGKQLKVSQKVITDFNVGNTYFDANKEYPIRKKRLDKYGLENKHDAFYNREEELKKLLWDLEYTTIPFQELQKKYSIKSSTLSLINNGKKYFDSNMDYPIRKTAKGDATRRVFSYEELLFIRELLENPEITMGKIAKIMACDSKVVAAINNGKRQPVEEWDYPLRKIKMKTGPKKKK